MNKENLTSKAHPMLSTFVLICSIVTIGLLFVMQEAEETRQVLASQGDYSVYITD